jgi:hypothetical protein
LISPLDGALSATSTTPSLQYSPNTMSTTTATSTKHNNEYACDETPVSAAEAAIEFAQQAERLGQYAPHQETDATGSTQAVEAKFITAQDPVIETADGKRLPAVPIEEATRLNRLRNVVESSDSFPDAPVEPKTRVAKDGTVHGLLTENEEKKGEGKSDTPLGNAKAPWQTSPLFPPLPMYGPPTLMRELQCWTFRISSAILSFLFLLVIILGAAFTSTPGFLHKVGLRLILRDPAKRRPFYQEEDRRKRARRTAEKAWTKQHDTPLNGKGNDVESQTEDEFPPLEGGPDPLKCESTLAELGSTAKSSMYRRRMVSSSSSGTSTTHETTSVPKILRERHTPLKSFLIMARGQVSRARNMPTATRNILFS